MVAAVSLNITRRGLITGLTSLLAAPAIVRVTSIMPVKALPVAAMTASEVAKLAQEWLDECTRRLQAEMADRIISPPCLLYEEAGALVSRPIRADEIFINNFRLVLNANRLAAAER
jgi:hypothetical protein